MTAVLIKSKLLNLVALGKAGASQRGGLLPRDKKSLADEADRGPGGSRKTAGPVLSTGPISCLASRYQIRGQEEICDSLQNNLSLPRGGPVQREVQRVP